MESGLSKLKTWFLVLTLFFFGGALHLCLTANLRVDLNQSEARLQNSYEHAYHLRLEVRKLWKERNAIAIEMARKERIRKGIPAGMPDKEE